MSLGKKLGIFLLALIMILCLGVDAWYLFIRFYGEEKMTSSTVNVSELEKSDGTKKNIFEINYFSNKNKNGLECFEIKLAYFTDETRDNVYWQGVQYVAHIPLIGLSFSSPSSINLDDTDGFVAAANSKNINAKHVGGYTKFLKDTDFYAGFFDRVINPLCGNCYSYQSMDGFQTLNSTNPIDKNSYFTISVGEKLMYMKFRGDDYVGYKNKDFDSEYSPVKSGEFDSLFQRLKLNIYENYNINYLADLLYNSIKTLPAGTNGDYVFEFGEELFRYYLVDEKTSTGTEISAEDRDLVKNEIKSYYSIKVKVSADGIRNSKESMFKVVKGSPNFSYLGSSEPAGEYSFGRELISLNLDYFDLIQIKEKKYALQLKEDLYAYFITFGDKLEFEINIDFGYVEKLGIEIIGYTSSPDLSKLNIKSSNIDFVEVDYA